MPQAEEQPIRIHLTVEAIDRAMTIQHIQRQHQQLGGPYAATEEEVQHATDTLGSN